MSCNDCSQHWFWKKIGRCQRCLDQLTVLSVVCWIIWWFAFRDNPTSIESVALIVAGFAFNILLFLHLWMRYVILPWQARKLSEKQRDKQK
ncbi:DUF3624 domain-containing protein [Vibrio vulnificus]|uniref:DUF3624 domain-containing protein n=1 Tax=Vibrio TaxID=662 RepID=UPI0005F1C351|nr:MULTISPECIES: DUF3624 domain-containing protein [Vibrio]EGQ9992680.1 DUF3624 domain-containing protein [Vibrio vulnificus]EGR0208830.1 DUF3624 domain-containing protein [Vibrio vulnificus]EGR7967889.1 DUF3624 domain-containing protein [Vibrio vulnificus]EHD0098624.1 DUF3624 domain-containing protein [Vibrio vulnificus]EHK8986715.1 DUF3624 domain-containing protein [Vibrio vulnificus]